MSPLREIKEEIDVDIKVLDYVHNTSFVSKRGNHVINMVFLSEIISGDPKPMSEDETESLIWLSTQEIIDYPNVPPWLLVSIKLADEINNRHKI